MPKKKKPKKRGPMYLFLLLLVPFAIGGCGMLDSITGVDDPEVIAGTKPSTLERVSEEAETALPWPWSLVAGLVGGYGVKAYRDARLARKAHKAAEGTPA